jgi:hypothetical protein
MAERTPLQIQAAETAQRAAAAAAAARERDAMERFQKQAEHEQAQSSAASAAEVRARAEHLKKQRDLILAQRKKQRDADFAAAPPQRPPPPPPGVAAAAPPVPGSSDMHRGAGYTGGEPTADAHRARLSVALASSMKSSLLGEDATTLDLQHRIDQHHKKVDLEATKAQLRAEVERERGMY